MGYKAINLIGYNMDVATQPHEQLSFITKSKDSVVADNVILVFSCYSLVLGVICTKTMASDL